MGSGEESADRRDWQRLLARWGALTAVVVACLTVTFFTAFGLASSEPGIGGDHDELLMAASVPGLYRLSMVFDAFGWLCMGGLIVIAGCALRRDAPVRAPLAAALGVTTIAGVIGAFLRLMVIGDLGRQVATGGGTDSILFLYRSVDWVIDAHFAAGQLTVGLGFMVLGSAALGVAWMPRRIAWLLVLPGITSLALLIGNVALDTFLFPLLLLHVGLLAALGLTMAVAWWRAGIATLAAMQPSEAR